MKRAAVTTLCGLLLSPSISWADVEVIPEAAHGVSPPLASIPAEQLNASAAVRLQRQIPLRRFTRPATAGAAVPMDDALQTTVGPQISVTPVNNFEGIGQGLGYSVMAVPPDPNGAAGNTQYVQQVNTSFAVFNKATGAVVYGPVETRTLWTGFGGQCETSTDGDGIVLYDKAANRWLISQFAVNGGAGPPFYECIAVSTTSDATGSYNRYAFRLPNFPDYPKIGVWPDAYYASFNMFDTTGTNFLGPVACALDRASMLTGATATMQCSPQLSPVLYSSLLPSDLDGSRPPPVGSPNYFVNLDVNGNALDIWQFHVDFANAANTTFTGPVSVPVVAYSDACGASGTCIPQPGTNQQLDSLGDRVMHRLAYRNFGSYETLVINHSVMVGSSVGVRWYELRNPGGAPAIYQQGTYAPDATYRWMGSIAMDRKGDIAVGYSTSSSSVFPSISYTGRLVGDPLGTLQTENLVIRGSGSQVMQRGQPGNRWGDYSGMTIDPVDDCTFWYTNEYLKTSGLFNWSTRIASFKFPQCGRSNAIVPILSSFLLLQ